MTETELKAKAMLISQKREKRENPIFFMKDLLELTEMLFASGRRDEAEEAFSEVAETYFHHGIESMIMHHVYSDFGFADRILALSDALCGTESEVSFAVIYYRAIDLVDSGNRVDETAVYEEALAELNLRKKGYVEEKLKIYRRYTSALRRSGRVDEARKYEDSLFQFKQDNIWPLD